MRAYTRKYTYDKIGNVLQMKQTGTNAFTRDFSYFANSNKLEKIETGSATLIQAFEYNTDPPTYGITGNQSKAGDNRHYEWTAANALFVYKNQASGSDPTIMSQYQYDAGGNRVSKMVRTGTNVDPTYEWTIYIDGVFEYHKLDDGTVYEKNYVHIMDDKSRICMVRIGTPFPDDIADATTYILENQIGSSVARLNSLGGAIDIEEYYPFGDSSLRTFTKKRYRYVGKEKDLESGLYYYGARYYAAWTCRFISIDPLASDYPFYTPYNYAGNKPINKVDIDGLQEEGNTGNSGMQSGVDALAQMGTATGVQGGGANQTTAQTQVHTVESGETLGGIAEQYGTTVDALAESNGISDPDYIQAGQEITVGGGTDNMSEGATIAYEWNTDTSVPEGMAAGTDRYGITNPSDYQSGSEKYVPDTLGGGFEFTSYYPGSDTMPNTVDTSGEPSLIDIDNFRTFKPYFDLYSDIPFDSVKTGDTFKLYIDKGSASFYRGAEKTSDTNYQYFNTTQEAIEPFPEVNPKTLPKK